MEFRTVTHFITLYRVMIITFVMIYAAPVFATQPPPDEDASVIEEQSPHVAETVKVKPTGNDEAIAERLTNILNATDWYSEINVTVEESVVFIDGKTKTEEKALWAGELASNVVDVVAVVNRIQVVQPSSWNLTPAITEIHEIWYKALQKLPRIGLGLVLLLLLWVVVKLVLIGIRRILAYRLNPLLQDIATRIISILLYLLGFYLVLQIIGLSALSTTILGGTGVAGLVAGIAFRDLLENYLASILISLRNPFQLGDLVEIDQHLGTIEKVTTRGTVLMNQDGNHVQIPNSIVYKSIIRNYTANPNRREIFDVGIGFENNSSRAQEIALQVLNDHPAVNSEPESLVLVDALGSATVNLKIQFWYDGSVYNGYKVKSSLIRLVKRSFEAEDISMPDEAREMIFPEGVPVRMLDTHPESTTTQEKAPPHDKDEEVSNKAEGSLENEVPKLRDQARLSREPEEGSSLLND